MTAEKLHDAIGLLPADLVAEADRKRSGKPKSIPWKRYAALAACFVLVLFAGRFALLLAAPKGAGAVKTEAAMDIPAAAPMEETAFAAQGWGTAAETLLEGPPALTVSAGDTSVTAGALCLVWDVLQTDGTIRSMRVDAALPEDTFDSCVLLEAKDGLITLAWETLPDSVTFRSWHRDGERVISDVFEGGSALYPNEAGEFTLSADAGTHLYEITAHWTQGWAAYTFRVTTPREE